ncbi:MULTISPECIES: M20 family metallopeptidase [Pigmentiphaga]|uniref:M20 family metallopeptidase n=1 Tax=Pigmentiphaga daeguensis TaxID=414049 RepID=A0ABP3LFB1_9BURK|nr:MULTISPECIES: M20 family metallopeptidase [unclassified Pigmentiphaga]OVZ65074.1 peptidase M20 [Pigmentiphaga sp. NML030171]
MDLSDLAAVLARRYDDELIPLLADYVRVPAKSPMFDPNWAEHGHLAAVVDAAAKWARAQPVTGLQVEIVAIPGRTPCLYFEAPATQGLGGDRTVLFYGHLDKQPEMTGWRQDLGPWTPKIEDGKLYGRGSADDGYAVYAALATLAAMDAQDIPRPRCVGLIETCEESGSYDLPAYLDLLAPRIGPPTLVVGLDSGCGNYEQLWVTTSLRGLTGGVLTVEILDEGVHSGMASGLVPSSFRIARQLLNRIDDPATGRVLLPELHAAIPGERLAQARTAGAILGDQVWKQFPWVGCSHGADGHAHALPTTTDPVEGILNRTWRPALSVTGAAGLPSIDAAGNVLRPKTSLKLSMRLPPTVDADRATRAMKAALEQDPPYQARVRFESEGGAGGWNAPPTAPWLARALDAASQSAFGQGTAWIGEGGTIPFMGMLGAKFPEAQFLITGVLGPRSNAHGPNEFLHIPYVKKLTAAVAHVIAQVR